MIKTQLQNQVSIDDMQTAPRLTLCPDFNDCWKKAIVRYIYTYSSHEGPQSGKISANLRRSVSSQKSLTAIRHDSRRIIRPPPHISRKSWSANIDTKYLLWMYSQSYFLCIMDWLTQRMNEANYLRDRLTIGSQKMQTFHNPIFGSRTPCSRRMKSRSSYWPNIFFFEYLNTEISVLQFAETFIIWWLLKEVRVRNVA
jgi:hypothetical protein